MSQVRLTIQPIDALIDVSRTIRITGLEPGQAIRLHSKTLRGKAVPWQSTADFIADSKGVVDLTQQAPVAGSYTGVEPMGLIWSQVPEIEGEREVFGPTVLDPIVTTVTVDVDGQRVQADMVQRLAASGVQRIEVREQGLVGTVFLPSTPGPHPAVMILNGSGGGMNEPRAALYASHGYVAFALAYFKAPGLSDYISNTPLEYFKRIGLAQSNLYAFERLCSH